jgi:hypothetical protein
MRGPQGLLMLMLCLATFGAVLFSMTGGTPAQEAQHFLLLVRNNDYQSALREFGDNTCHCAPEGGYGAFLRYDQGHDPNLAFLMGTNFNFGQATVIQLPYNGEKYLMPWDKPEDTLVHVPVTFPDQKSEPFFIPLEMAFGHKTHENDLKSFAGDPTKDWIRAFTIRLRAKLKGAQITAPPGAAPAELAAPDALMREIMPKDAARYSKPADAGTVMLADGRIVSADSIQDQLPRLKSVVVDLKIVRRGFVHRWTVKKVGLEDIVVTSNGKEFQLKEPGTH